MGVPEKVAVPLALAVKTPVGGAGPGQRGRRVPGGGDREAEGRAHRGAGAGRTGMAGAWLACAVTAVAWTAA